MKKGLKRAMTLVAVVLGFTVMASGCDTTIKGDKSDTDIQTIGLTQFMDHPALNNTKDGFIQGLAKEGFVEGENISIDYKSAQGDMAIAGQISQTYVNANYDLLVGIATPSAQLLYALAYEKEIPVVFAAVSDPVYAKIAVSETEPMAGITGVSDKTKTAVESQLKMIREIMPEAKKIGILYTTSEANSVSTLREYKEKASEFGFEIIERGIAKQAEITQATDYLLTKVDCLNNLTDNTVVSSMGVVLEKANALNIPVFGSESEQLKMGCLASSGLDYVEHGILAGEMAGKILKGEDISKMPFKTMAEDKPTINPEVASKLGIVIPSDLLERADKIS